MAKPHSEHREGKPNQPQRPFLTPPTSHIHLQDEAYQLQNENEIMTRNNIPNPDEDHFNILTLLNGQQDIHRQSFDMM